MKSPRKPYRIDELDSLRGIAALCVVLNHMVLLWIDVALQHASAFTRGFATLLLQPISAGHEAVILFFILSGLVLSIPAQEGKPQPYSKFVIRRIFRIYFPYLAALTLAVIGNSFFFGPVTGSAWFHQFWTTPVHESDVLQHIAFLGSFDPSRFDPPIWSLVHEMRISLVFPALCWLAIAVKPARFLPIAMVLSLADILCGRRLANYYSYATTLHYVAFFVIGICIFYYWQPIRELFLRLSGESRVLLFCVALLFYAYPSRLLVTLQKPDQRIDLQAIGDWSTAIGASLFVVFGMNSPAVGKFLLNKPARWLGTVSYSLYLTHFVVLLVLVHAFCNKININLLLLIFFALSLAVAQVFFVLVERPSRNLGRKLSNWFMPPASDREYSARDRKPLQPGSGLL